MPSRLLMLLLLLCLYRNTFAQDSLNASGKPVTLPNSFLHRLHNKTASLEQRLEKKTTDYTSALSKKEAALKKALLENDSASAAYLYFNDPEKKYGELSDHLKNDTAGSTTVTGVEYLPYSDSLQGTLHYLEGQPGVEHSLAEVQKLQQKMMDAESVKQFIGERKEQLKQYIASHAGLPPSVMSLYQEYNTELYYYSSQLQEFKATLNDPDRALSIVLKALNKLPAFASFMRQNSFLSGLFNVPDNYDMQASLPGMQTMDVIERLIQTQVSAGGPSAATSLTQNLSSAESQLAQLKNKLNSLGKGGGDADLPPGFKPNNQRSKTLLQRLEYGVNMQTVQTSTYFPATTDFGLSLGYKLNDNNSVGLGASYKVGWGSGINHVHVTGQGAGLRSFVDIHIKGGFSATGGYEYNYQPVLVPVQGPAIKAWQKSGLVGLSKSVSLRTKLFKKTKVQLLWDFLSYSQRPQTQPIKFRINYNF